MSTQRGVVWSGMDELRAEFKKLPETAHGEALKLAEGAANGAAVDLRAAYPVGPTGNLRKGVVVTHFSKGKLYAGAVVKNTAPHAWIFENGTQARHTDLGANRGAMPPGHVFIPIIIRARHRLVEQFKALLLRLGASSVTGNG